jgi:hypothetical protein
MSTDNTNIRAMGLTNWRAMKRRCYEPKMLAYKDYGGRGITVCERWRKSFANFVSDMGQRPSLSHTIERLNNDGNYEPGNCIWATRKEQNRNSRHCHMIDHNGGKKPMSVWAEQAGIARDTLKARLKYGWSIREALQGHRDARQCPVCALQFIPTKNKMVCCSGRCATRRWCKENPEKNAAILSRKSLNQKERRFADRNGNKENINMG